MPRSKYPKKMDDKGRARRKKSTASTKRKRDTRSTKR